MWQKLKLFLGSDAVFFVLLILFVGIGSFGLGRLSVEESSSSSAATALLALPNLSVPAKEVGNPVVVVASQNGTKYHLPDCPGAKQLKSETKITFNSIQEAKAAGYTPATNCAGLRQ